MFVAGLYLKPQDLKLALKQYKLITKAILANALIIPLIGLGLFAITPMSPSVQEAYLMVTFSFGLPLALNFAKGLRANIPFVTVLIFVLAFASSITMPVLLDVFLSAPLSVGRTFILILLFTVIFQITPLLLGLFFGDSQTIRRILLRPLALITAGAGIVLIALVVLVGLAGIAYIGIWPPVSMLVLAVVSLGVGWLLGGPILIDRKVMALNSALRNFPIGLLLATSVFSDFETAIGVAVFAAIMILTVLVFSRLVAKRIEAKDVDLSAPPTP